MDNLSTYRPGALHEAFPGPKPRICGTASSSSTPPSTAVGSTLPRSNSTSWSARASTVVSTRSTSFGTKWPLGRRPGIGSRPRSTGSSPPPTPCQDETPLSDTGRV